MRGKSIWLGALFGAATLLTSCGNSDDETSATASATAPQAAVVKAVNFFDLDQEFGRAKSYVDGNMLFTLYHEAGHMLLREFEIPYTGSQENAADEVATLQIIPWDSIQTAANEKEKETPGQKRDREEGDELILAAAKGWFDTAASRGAVTDGWWTEHGIAEQRGARILCLLTGAELAVANETAQAAADDARDNGDTVSAAASSVATEGQFAKEAAKQGFPTQRITACSDIFLTAEKNWNKHLDPHRRTENDRDEDPTTVNVSYDPPAPGLEKAAIYLERSGVMQSVADDLAQSYKLPRDVSFKGASCDSPNATWDRETATLTICYELVRWFAQRAPDWKR